MRLAKPPDANGIASAVGELLVELGGSPPPLEAMQDAARELLEIPESGVVVLAEAGGLIVGLLAASWPTSIHTAGRYGLIQDLWVQRSWRGMAIGGALLDGFMARGHELGIMRIEVGLPKDSFEGLKDTEAFYRKQGFELLGSRMRRVLR